MTTEKKALIISNRVGVIQTFSSIFEELGYQTEMRRVLDLQADNSTAQGALDRGITAIYMHQPCFVASGKNPLTTGIMKGLTDSGYQGIVLLGSKDSLSGAEREEIGRSQCYEECKLPKSLPEVKLQIVGLESRM
jgi:hypothetical protein